MSKGALVSMIVAVLAIGMMLMAFLTNASPYVTIAEARSLNSDSLHVAGDLDKSTLTAEPKQGVVRFALIDEKGERINVEYKGPQPSNLGEATKVVVVGGIKDNVFYAHQLLVKCPSKYQGEKT